MVKIMISYWNALILFQFNVPFYIVELICKFDRPPIYLVTLLSHYLHGMSTNRPQKCWKVIENHMQEWHFEAVPIVSTWKWFCVELVQSYKKAVEDNSCVAMNKLFRLTLCLYTFWLKGVQGFTASLLYSMIHCCPSTWNMSVPSLQVCYQSSPPSDYPSTSQSNPVVKATPKGREKIGLWHDWPRRW